MRSTISVLLSLVFAHGMTFCAQAFAAPAGTASSAVVQQHAAQELGELINEAGRLRMLTERMGKAYAQVLLGVMPDRAQEQINQSQKRFDQTLMLLHRGAGSAQSKSGLEAVTGVYHLYVKALAKPADKANMVAVHKLTDELVANAETLTMTFQAQGPVASAKIVNISGRQRMLSQRMARQFFAAVALGGKPNVEKSAADFKAAMAILESAPLTSRAIKDELEQAKVQWMFFEQALLGKNDTATNLKDVATSSERLLEVMDNLTGLYSKALKVLTGALENRIRLV